MHVDWRSEKEIYLILVSGTDRDLVPIMPDTGSLERSPLAAGDLKGNASSRSSVPKP